MKNILFLMAWILPFCAQAQTKSAVLDVNNVRAVVNNNGALFWDFNEGQFKIPVGNEEISTIRSSGLWIVGKDGKGNLHGHVQMYNDNDRSDFGSGWMDKDGSISEADKIWKVSKDQILSHKEDYADNGKIDNPIPEIFNYKGPFYEVPGMENGRYEPELGEYPMVWIRGCEAIIPDEMISIVYHTEVNNTESGLNPIPISIGSQIFSFACSENELLNNTVFVSTRMVNFSDVQFDSAAIGIFCDFDLGCPDDDFIGAFPDQSLFFGYNGKDEDSGCSPSFESNTPVQAVTILQGPIAPKVFGDNRELLNPALGEFYDTLANLVPTKFIPFGYDSGDLGAPQNSDYFNYLHGLRKDGSAISNGGVPIFGDPADPSSQAEENQGNVPGDRRMVASMGPFRLDPGIIMQTITAYTVIQDEEIGRGEIISELPGVSATLRRLKGECFQNPCDFISQNENKQESHKNIVISPNPNEGIFIAKNLVGDSYRIMDTQGRTLALKSVKHNNSSSKNGMVIQVDHLKPGMYFLVTNDEAQVAKFIIR